MLDCFCILTFILMFVLCVLFTNERGTDLWLEWFLFHFLKSVQSVGDMSNGSFNSLSSFYLQTRKNNIVSMTNLTVNVKLFLSI
jgi:hypothetical protein